MSGGELVIIIVGAITGVISAVSQIHTFLQNRKNRKDIKTIKEQSNEIKQHTQPRIILTYSDGSISTPHNRDLPEIPEQKNTDDVELNEPYHYSRYEEKKIYYDKVTGDYLESITPRPCQI